MMGALQELRDAAKGDRRRRTTHRSRAARPRCSAGSPGFKQICVRFPALLTESRRGLGDRSGKVSRLVDLCSQIIDENQAVVVFTQFASFVPDLADHLRHARRGSRDLDKVGQPQGPFRTPLRGSVRPTGHRSRSPH